MGLTKEDCRLLFHSKTLGVSFSETLTLGRQRLYATKEDITQFLLKYGSTVDKSYESNLTSIYSENLFEVLGAIRQDSLDYSEYEGASIIHDLNHDIPSMYHTSFSAVIDSGTLEHVFNFPVAIRNCMNMLKVGGHFIGISPTNNFMGHGFYQFSPELYYRIFSEENGFNVRKMYIRNAEDDASWYLVANPKQVKSRVELVGDKPMFLMILAEKVKKKDIFRNSPYQSDYSTAWKYSDENKKGIVSKFRRKTSTAIQLIRTELKKSEKISDLGIGIPSYFQKVDV